MKTLRALLGVALALAVSVAARADTSARAWLETYYLDPEPERLPLAVRQLSREGYFEEPGRIPLAIGFLGTVFARNPSRVDTWLLSLSDLPLNHQRLLAVSLWQAGHALGPDLMNVLSEYSPLRTEVRRLASAPSRPIEETPVLSPQSMNLQWGAFLATGDDRHIIAILDGMGHDHPALDAAARVALAENAAAHPRVMEICRAQLDRQPASVRAEVRAALQKADAARPRT